MFCGLVIYALVVSDGRTVFPLHLSIEKKLVPAPEASVWVAALQRRVSSEEFEGIVKTNYQGRAYALGLFAHNGLTNHVRILIEHGADTSESAMEALRSSGMSNAAALIDWVVKDLRGSSSNNAAVNMLD